MWGTYSESGTAKFFTHVAEQIQLMSVWSYSYAYWPFPLSHLQVCVGEYWPSPDLTALLCIFASGYTGTRLDGREERVEVKRQDFMT